MEERLVSFETAKLAKDKGFNEFTDTLWSTHDDWGDKYNTLHDEGYAKWNSHEGGYITSKTEQLYSAPTQSLLQKWIRDTHKLRLEVQSLIDCTYAYSIYQELQDGNYCKQIAFEYTEQSSYEEALETGLKHALKLI